jgi:hypothetical protein
MTPYQYGALNPIKNVDLNGDSIIVNAQNTITISVNGVVGLTVTYYTPVYFEGSNAYYEANGLPYDGNDPYVCDVSNALGQIDRGVYGRTMVDYLESSTNNVSIRKYGGQNGTDADATSGLIRWNPSWTQTGADVNDLESVDPFIGLAHELGHVENVWAGPNERGDWWNNGQGEFAANSEKYATFKENLIRAENGIPLRKYYAIVGNDSFAVNPTPILNDDGTNKWFNGRTGLVLPTPSIPPSFIFVNPSTIPNGPIKY